MRAGKCSQIGLRLPTHGANGGVADSLAEAMAGVPGGVGASAAARITLPHPLSAFRSDRAALHTEISSERSRQPCRLDDRLD